MGKKGAQKMAQQSQNKRAIFGVFRRKAFKCVLRGLKRRGWYLMSRGGRGRARIENRGVPKSPSKIGS